MRRIESPLDHERGTVTYDLGDGRWATFDSRTVEKVGLAPLLDAYGVPAGLRLVVLRDRGERKLRISPMTDDGLFSVEGAEERVRVRLTGDALEVIQVETPAPTRIPRN